MGSRPFNVRASVLLLCLTVAVSGQRSLRPPKNTCTSGLASIGASCILKQERTTQSSGFVTAFCSSVLELTTPTLTQISTSTDTVTITSTTTTFTNTITKPATAETTTKTNTLNSTSTITTTTTETTATFTSFSATITTTSTTTTYIHTCGGDISSTSVIPPSSVHSSSSSVFVGTASSRRSSPSFSGAPYDNSSSSASWRPSGTARGVLSLPPYPTPVAKRQARTLINPPCVKHYKAEYGQNGLSSACQCFHLTTPSPTTVISTLIDPSNTLTSTTLIKVEVTTFFTPTETKTHLTTTTKKSKTTFTTTTSVAATVYKASTRTEVVTVTSFTSLPTPSSFNIYYVDSATNQSSPSNNFFSAVTAPGGNGIMLAPEASADNFGLDDQNRLIDFTDGGFLTKNTADLYPFEFLQTGATTLNTPICEACNGFLTCNYPGTIGNTFALCYGFLALGQPGVFGKDANDDGMVDCVAIALQYK